MCLAPGVVGEAGGGVKDSRVHRGMTMKDNPQPRFQGHCPGSRLLCCCCGNCSPDAQGRVQPSILGNVFLYRPDVKPSFPLGAPASDPGLISDLHSPSGANLWSVKLWWGWTELTQHDLGLLGPGRPAGHFSNDGLSFPKQLHCSILVDVQSLREVNGSSPTHRKNKEHVNTGLCNYF